MTAGADETWSRRLVVTREHLRGFAELSGDDNPIHVDPAYASTTPFELPVAHGMFLFSLVRAGLRELAPGWLRSQHLVFPNPTPEGTPVEVRLRVTGRTTDGAVEVAAEVLREDGAAGLTGTCVVEPDT